MARISRIRFDTLQIIKAHTEKDEWAVRSEIGTDLNKCNQAMYHILRTLSEKNKFIEYHPEDVMKCRLTSKGFRFLESLADEDVSADKERAKQPPGLCEGCIKLVSDRTRIKVGGEFKLLCPECLNPDLGRPSINEVIAGRQHSAIHTAKYS